MFFQNFKGNTRFDFPGHGKMVLANCSVTVLFDRVEFDVFFRWVKWVSIVWFDRLYIYIFLKYNPKNIITKKRVFFKGNDVNEIARFSKYSTSILFYNFFVN